MFPDGICRVTDSYYTKTVQFQDINYQLNQNEDKTAIFDGWCDFLNYFDSSVRFQLSFVNMSANKDNYARYITISPQGDDFDSIRLEYTQMLQNQLARGNNGLIKTKYLTFGVEADSLKAAKPRLERIETDILNNFKRLGVAAEPMAEIAVLKTHIANYAKTRDVYAGYRKTGYSRKYLAEHEGDILLHKAAKKAFDELGVKKLPSVKGLQEEYAKLLSEKKAAYAEYRRSRDEMRELLLHKQNVDRMLGKNEREEEKKKEHDRQ